MQMQATFSPTATERERRTQVAFIVGDVCLSLSLSLSFLLVVQQESLVVGEKKKNGLKKVEKCASRSRLARA